MGKIDSLAGKQKEYLRKKQKLHAGGNEHESDSLPKQKSDFSKHCKSLKSDMTGPSNGKGQDKGGIEEQGWWFQNSKIIRVRNYSILKPRDQ